MMVGLTVAFGTRRAHFVMIVEDDQPALAAPAMNDVKRIMIGALAQTGELAVYAIKRMVALRGLGKSLLVPPGRHRL